ncbi:MAG: hypothetical protein QOI78_2619 [Actinomycetota bacterium]|nr:hypothetical protein [Actinomycetota bacterium]
MKSGEYVAATAEELATSTAADKVAGGVSHKVLFRRRGEIRFDGDMLTLRGWAGGQDLNLRSSRPGAADTDQQSSFISTSRSRR